VCGGEGQNLTGKEECPKLCQRTALRSEQRGGVERLEGATLRQRSAAAGQGGGGGGTICSCSFAFDAATSILFFTLSDNFSVWKKGDEIAARSGILFQSVAAGVAREAVQLPLRACFHAAHACLQMRSSMTNLLFQAQRPNFIPQPRQRREEQRQ
jgi:hypothetical protein